MSKPKVRRKMFIGLDGNVHPVGPSGYVPKAVLRAESRSRPPAMRQRELSKIAGPFTKGRKRRRKKFGGRP